MWILTLSVWGAQSNRKGKRRIMTKNEKALTPKESLIRLWNISPYYEGCAMDFYNVLRLVEDCEWRPISEFDDRMFSIMSDGTPDGTEVFKYKGHVPEHFIEWMPLPAGWRKGGK